MNADEKKIRKAISDWFAKDQPDKSYSEFVNQTQDLNQLEHTVVWEIISAAESQLP